MILAIGYANVAGLRSAITVERIVATGFLVAVLVVLATWVESRERR